MEVVGGILFVAAIYAIAWGRGHIQEKAERARVEREAERESRRNR